MAVDYDIVIIGGGSGGLVVASAAAQLKAKVALVEKNKLGGDCLWYGCVPSKSLIHAARVAHEVKEGHRVGIYTQPPQIKFTEAMGHVKKAIAAIEPNDSPERFEGLGVEVIFGSGQFTDKKTFEINGRKLTARAFVVSTGSSPAIPPVEGLKEAGFLTNEQVFSLTEQPKSLAVIGSGPIGCELGQSFHRLGTEVTLFASRDRLMPKEDPDAAAVIEQQFVREGLKILKKARLKRVEVIKGKKHLFTENDSQAAAIVDEILVATGRTPNVNSLNLKAAGVDYDKKGIHVNDKLQTTNSNIFACGDVIGGYQFTHVAGYEAVTVLQNALNPLPIFLKNIDYRVIPWATFTDPEVARVGMSEEQARKRYADVLVLKLPFAEVDRAQAEDATVGFNKIIVRKNGEILGAHMVGKMAGELIQEIVLAMANRLPVSALTGIHIYPTLTEINSKTGLLLSKKKYAENETLQNFLTKFFGFLRSM
ncbi:dihydrolipoyl dehydrogenase family protein [[Limnothrix rosea] IAM M-220]|uniref:dihydrolipoyl dehydrogenase family protein n=1 Tax=[Limnothrix rosea] IAM M-220 TaxID=454133 RepID=UPI000962A41F|nr:FAD-dependent oxidoreductase [[Limnothrix rosea] IAM M-220]OKH19099.1 pyridine nucleotide-disulfide oxidoreductase [[Limnothrix rosea] IAM M-220]